MQVFFPKSFGFIRTDQLGYGFINQSGRVYTLKFEHIPFGDKPVAQVSAAHQEIFTIRSDDFRTFYTDKTVCLSTRKEWKTKQRQNDEAHSMFLHDWFLKSICLFLRRHIFGFAIG